MNTISVIIPVKNGEANLDSCLNAVFNQTLKPNEVIIVDGHSTDKTIEIAQKYPTKIIFEDYGTVGGARQLGVQKAENKFVAFTDADCIPNPDWLENLVKEFSDDIVGVGGGIQNIGKGIWEKSIAYALDSFLGSANSVQDRVLKNKQFVKSISGCNSMYRRDDVLKIGGYNTSYSMNEDTDLNKRLLKFGKILYTPDAIVLHNQDRNLTQFVKRMYSFGFGRGKNKLFDLQTIPPVAALFTVICLFISPQIFLLLLLLYFAVLVFFDFLILSKAKSIVYLFTIPIIFILEHVSYSFGFWRGIIKGYSGGKI
ncbi:glycosyltransferase [Methanogenium organophilum]|uniref:Glycosyltransferase n=1 Tax=Methanogenium organophilum TaxID=2199 RepID=A0A9X9T7M7_METOG|nr:glycosyltransferase [Methanogenium organophilum]WAI00850.1 glycosyltransferase [Methanogenium organophilum]